jgi:hypothetical protein
MKAPGKEAMNYEPPSYPILLFTMIWNEAPTPRTPIRKTKRKCLISVVISIIVLIRGAELSKILRK